ncbi:MAG TPA: protein-disulfide reductase DsbD domain-containing protein [Phnomibacter sp.]|nr:protein-disulfide reductase DsbD domain-containing protein [Phnomibacter sp.]
MKKIFTLIFVAAAIGASAQIKDPVKWSFESKKIDSKNYEVLITATMDPKWHIYTMDHEGDIGVATTFNFNKNPLGDLKGGIASSQKPKKMKDPSTGEMVSFYEGKVTFTQKVSLKSPVKTTFTGSVEYMACDDKMCLPPKERTFSIVLQ